MNSSELLVELRHPFSFFYRMMWKQMAYRNESYFKKIVDNNPEKAIEISWHITFGKRFPWDNPITLNEKICWLSAKSDTSLWTRLADKYEVRDYISSLGLGDYLAICYGVWDNVDDINWDDLPESFVLKCTHDCGSTVIVKSKAQLNIQETKKFLWNHLQRCWGYATCEPHYTKIQPRIIAEELLPLTNDDLSSSIIDYKIWCFDGKAELAFVCYDRHLESDKSAGHTVYDIYDINDWTPKRELLSEPFRHAKFKSIPKPKNYEQMINLAERLANGFPQVRVDLYNINGDIYFGELTFTSQGGRMLYFTTECQKLLGGKVTLPVKF